MTSEINVRPARASDLEEVEKITRDTWGPGSGDHVPERFPGWLEEETGILLVAEIAGRVIGVVRGEDQGSGEMWCEGMRVHPDTRTRGVATRLQGELNRLARERGFKVWRLASGNWNTPAHRAAERNGFQLVHTATGWTAEPGEPGELPVLETLPALDPDALIGLDGWRYISGRNLNRQRLQPGHAFLGDATAWALARRRERDEWDGPRLAVGQLGGGLEGHPTGEERNRQLELLGRLRGHAAVKGCAKVALWWPKGDDLPARAGYQIIYEGQPPQALEVLVFECRAKEKEK